MYRNNRCIFQIGLSMPLQNDDSIKSQTLLSKLLWLSSYLSLRKGKVPNPCSVEMITLRKIHHFLLLLSPGSSCPISEGVDERYLRIAGIEPGRWADHRRGS